MSEKLIFISSSDSKYYPLLREWVHSIRSFPEGKTADIGILDVGMTDEQIETLKPHVNTIVRPAWPCKIPSRRIRGRDYLKACVARPFIPDYFPGFDTYIWMDCDTWVQDWQAVDLLIKGAQKGAIAIVPQTDRAYGKAMRIKWLGPLPWKPRSFYYSNAKKAFSGKVARSLFPYSTLNAGVFAIKAESPHWMRWQTLIKIALRKGRVFTAEQLTLGILIYIEGYKTEFLPAWCNWLCTTKPAWDDQRQKFVEPFLPNTDIGIIHMSGLDEMRLDRSIVDSFQTLEEKIVTRSCRYPFFDGEKIN